MKLASIFFSFLFIFHSLGQNDGAKGEMFKNALKATGKTHVILIGVSEYRHLDENKQLKYADDDTELMSAYLSTWENVNIKKFINEKASSKDEIGYEIHNTLNVEAESGDQVIIYFSGHGDVDTTYGDGYLLLNGVSPPNDRLYRFNQALSMNDMEMMMEKAANNGVEVLLITDACKSGSIQNARDANQRMLNIGKNTSSLVSCGPEELSFESIKYGGGHGVFTYYLVQGLMGLADANSDMVITFKELSRYVEDNVAEAQSDAQNPQSRGIATKKIALVDNDLKSAAEKEDNLMLSVNTFSNNKSVQQINQITGTTKSWIKLMQELIEQGVMFNDEIVGVNKKPSISINEPKTAYISKNPIKGITTNSDGSLLASPANKDVAIFDSKNQLIQKLKGHKGGVTTVKFSPWGNSLISGSWDNSLILWDANTGVKIKQLKGLSDEAYAIEFIDQSTVSIGNNKGDLYFWNLEDNSKVKFKVSKKRITDIKRYKSAIFIASADGKIRVFDLNKKVVINEINAHNRSATAMVIAPLKSQLISVGHDKSLKIWDLNTLQLVKKITLDYSENRGLAIDPFETFCFVASRRYDLDVVNLDNDRVQKHIMSSKSSGLASVNVSNNNTVTIGDSKGRIHTSPFSIKQNKYSALEIHKLLSDNPDNKNIQYKIDGTMLIGLNNFVNQVLNPLVNGNAILPSNKKIVKAKRYAQKALEIGSDLETDLVKLKINLLLLEIFEIIELKKTDQYSTALNKVNEIINADPKGAYAFNISGALLVKLNKIDDAKKSGDLAEKFAPGWAEASCGSGKILLSENDYDGAEIKFKETIEKGPNLSKGYFYLGKVYNLQGRFGEASINLTRANEIDEGVPAIIESLLSNAMLTGDAQRVKQIIRKYEAHDIGKVFITKGDFAFLEPKTRKDYSGIEQNYQTAISIDSNANSLNSLGYFYLRLLNDEKAKSFIEETFNSETGSVKIKPTTQLKRKCKELFKKALSMDNHNLQSEIGKLLTRGSLAESSTIKNLLSKYNSSAEIYTAIGRYYLYKNENKLAAKSFKKAMAINPRHYPAFLLAMETNVRVGKAKKNTSIIGKYQSKNANSSVMKYKKELTEYLLLY